MIVVECSAVRRPRPPASGSGKAPARPAIPPGGPALTGPDRACATSAWLALAKMAAACAA